MAHPSSPAAGPGASGGAEWDLDAALAEATRLARRSQEIQQAVEAMETVGEAGDGRVRVTIRGTGLVTRVVIDLDAVHVFGVDGLGDVVVAAVSDGTRKAILAARDRFAEIVPDPGLFDGLLAKLPASSASSAPRHWPCAAQRPTAADFDSW